MKEIKTNNGKKGGWLVGKRHYDKSGKPLGGIKAIVTDAGGKPVELEGGEVIINREASKKHWKELSRINQSAGGGVPIGPPSGVDEDPEDNYEHGGKIDFNPNHIPNKWILSYAKNIKENHPEIWKLGGNIFGNEAFKNLKRVAERGHWLDSEEWMYVKWRAYVARHQRDYRIEGVVAMLKWVDKVEKGWPYMKQLIEEKIKKIESKKKGWKHKMKKGGTTLGRTPAPKKDQIKGSNVNKSGSSASTKSASSIKFDETTIESIKNKIKEHNEAHPDKKITLASAKAVVRRGMGAYSSSHRPKITGGKPNSRTAWGLARLNAFTYKIVHRKSKSGKYTQDDDLIEELGYSVSKMKDGGEIEDLMSKGIVELKMYKTTPKHAKEYGLDSVNPLFVQNICVSEPKRLKGIGKKVLAYIDEYAVNKGHDVVFGHITQKATMTKDERPTYFCDVDMIKNWLHSNGYAINEDNNDFHKIVGGKVKTKSFVVFFKSNLLNDIIYTNIESDSLSLDEAIEVQKQNYSWLEIDWIKGFEAKKGNSKMKFFLQNIKPKWETKPDLSVEMKDGQIVFSKGKDSVAFDLVTLFKNVSGKGEQLIKFNEAYMTHGDAEIMVDSDFNFDRNKIFELMLDKMKEGGNVEYQSRNLGGSLMYYKRKGDSKWEFISKDEFDKNANQMNTILFKNGGSTDNSDYFIPANGTLITKDKKTKLDYKKVGNDYEFSVFDGEPNPVENYSRVQYKKRSDNRVLMNYNQFVNYLYNEGYIDDKFKDGGELAKGIKAESEHQDTISKIYHHKVAEHKAAELIARDHLKEDPKYYSKLAQMEGKKFAFGGTLMVGLKGILQGRTNKQVEVVSISDKIVTYLDVESKKKIGLYKDKFIEKFIEKEEGSAQQSIQPQTKPTTKVTEKIESTKKEPFNINIDYTALFEQKLNTTSELMKEVFKEQIVEDQIFTFNKIVESMGLKS